jgi:hypothetical protein
MPASDHLGQKIWFWSLDEGLSCLCLCSFIVFSMPLFLCRLGSRSAWGQLMWESKPTGAGDVWTPDTRNPPPYPTCPSLPQCLGGHAATAAQSAPTDGRRQQGPGAQGCAVLNGVICGICSFVLSNGLDLDDIPPSCPWNDCPPTNP